MQPIRIIDADFNLLAELDNYESLVWARRWHKPGEFELHINANKQSTEHLQKGRLVLAGSKVGLILHRELVQGSRGKGEEQVAVKGMSLAAIVGRRITIPPAGYAYDRVTAPAETIMKGYVTRNCITPADSKRSIPNLVVAPDQGRGAQITFQTRLKQLDEELEKLSLVSGLGWDVRLDMASLRWEFDVQEGRDLTAGQSTNPPVIFSADFDAVKAQTFVESDIGHKNTAYVGGQGEGVERDIVEVGSGLSGLDRLETFVDARDLEQAADLPERGLQKLAEVAPVITFDTEILTEGPYKYGEDWDLGDVVTVQNRKWGVTLDSRITEVTEVYEPAGFQLRATFGSSVPTLPDRLKQELDAPLVEKGLLEKGDPGEPGTDGVGLNFLWDGTRLGVKREDEALYTYVDLEGPQGIQGLPGEKGADGKDLEFSWDGTRLGVRREGDAAYQYVDLKGEKGDVGLQGKSLEFSWNGTQLGIRAEGDSVYQYVDLEGPQGPEGPPGSDATVTQTNIEGALGYTPVSPTQLATKASAAETNAKAYTDTRLADKASNIHTHSIDDITSLDIEIGGRNLFIDNLMLNVQNYEYISPYYYYEITGLIPDQVYTISVRDDFDFSGVPKPTAGNRAIRINNIKQNSTNNVINVTSTGVTTATIQISSNDEGMLYIVVYQPVILEHFPQAIKLEKGNVATDWTPAPEDINAAVQTIFKNKVDKVAGKQLSSEDYTTTEKTKLAGIESGANKYTHPSTHPASMIVESASRRFVSDTEKAAWNNKQNALGYTPVNKAGDNMTGALSVEHTAFPVVDITRNTSGAGGNVYGGARMVRKTTNPTNGVGIGFYFQAPNSNKVVTHAGMFGGALGTIAAGSERGEIVFGPSYAGQDPYTRRDLVIRAISASKAEAELNGKLKTDQTLASDSNDTVATKGYVDSNAGGGGTKIITSPTEPTGLTTGDQWHKEI